LKIAHIAIIIMKIIAVFIIAAVAITDGIPIIIIFFWPLSL
jgi:hypothetical protein